MGPHPAVAAIRLAVRRALHDILSEHAAGPLGPGARPAPRDPEPPAMAAAAGAFLEAVVDGDAPGAD
ncbi:tRNA lysidine(34) synthetase TilS, partial [Streptomyces sp. DSM 41979]|nr:tRNA lysidine(34) synthetase TilS [Streptomyces sp. DSM 41979]